MARRKSRVTAKSSVWKTRMYFLVAAGAAVTISLIIRKSMGPKPAAAQAPAGGGAQAQITDVAPKRRTVSLAQQRQLKIMATVNREQVPRQKLAHECIRRFGKPVLESMVNKHLIMQACNDRGIRITEQDVENEIGRMAQKFGLSKERWLQLLRDERDIKPDQYRREIIWPTLALRLLAANDIVVTRDELQKAFESEHGARVQVLMISVGSRNKADQVRAKAVADPLAFGKLAKDHSEERTSASARGRIPPIRRHMGNPELERMAFSLKPGEISNVLHIANQYIILKCEKHIPANHVAARYRQSSEQKLSDRIRDNKLRAATAKLFKSLQQKAKVYNVYNDPNLKQKLPGVAATINGRQISMRDLGEECLLRHGVEVLDGEINRVLLTQALRDRKVTVTRGDIDQEIGRAAVSYGFERKDGSPDIQAWIKKITEEEGGDIDLYVSDAVWPTVVLKKLVGGRVQVTEEDVRKAFEANYGERVRVLAIVMSNQRQANQVWEMARQNPTDAFFGSLAEQYSIEPVSRTNRGQVPPVRKHGGRALVEGEAFRLRPGELSSIVAVGDKFVVMRCQGRTKQVVTDINAVRGELQRDIAEKKLRVEMTKEYDRLKESAEIHNYLTGETVVGKRGNRAPAVSALPRGKSR